MNLPPHHLREHRLIHCQDELDTLVGGGDLLRVGRIDDGKQPSISIGHRGAGDCIPALEPPVLRCFRAIGWTGWRWELRL